QRRAAISTFRGAEAVPAPDPAGMGDMDPGHVTDALLVVGPGCSPAWAEPVGGGAAGRVARLDARAGSGEPGVRGAGGVGSGGEEGCRRRGAASAVPSSGPER